MNSIFVTMLKKEDAKAFDAER